MQVVLAKHDTVLLQQWDVLPSAKGWAPCLSKYYVTDYRWESST